MTVVLGQNPVAQQTLRTGIWKFARLGTPEDNASLVDNKEVLPKTDDLAVRLRYDMVEQAVVEDLYIRPELINGSRHRSISHNVSSSTISLLSRWRFVCWLPCSL